MRFGLFFINSAGDEDWLRESNREISIWDSSTEADKWRRDHTVFPNKYEVRRVTPKILKEDEESFK